MKTQKFVRLIGAALLTASLGLWSAEADPLTFYSTNDADIDRLGGAGRGLIPYMVVKNRYGAGGSSSWEVDSLINFDLSSIPPGTNIPSATLHLYYYSWGDANPTGRPLTCYRITSDWREETVTWPTRPGWLPPGEWTDSTSVPGSYGWMEWDVTEDVQAFVDGTATNHGWCLMDETYWGHAGIPITRFRTRQHDTHVPYLEVVPEPATLYLLGLGTLAAIRRRG